jgi:hypothetical protein
MAKDAAKSRAERGAADLRKVHVTRLAKGKVAIHEELPELRASYHAIPLAAPAQERRAAGSYQSAAWYGNGYPVMAKRMTARCANTLSLPRQRKAL